MDRRMAALWHSDGTAAGTSVLVQFTPLAPESVPLFFLGELPGFLVFAADDGLHGQELWRTDGSGPGTELLADVRPGAPGSWISQARVAAGRLFFSASDGNHGSELWASDAAAVGTSLVADLYPGPHSASPEALTPVGDSLLFVADDGLYGRELWRLPLAATPARRGASRTLRRSRALEHLERQPPHPLQQGQQKNL